MISSESARSMRPGTRECGRSGGANIFALQDSFWITLSGYGEHRPPDLLCGQDVIRKHRTQQGKKWFSQHVENTIGFCPRANSIERLDPTGTKSGAKKWHFEQGIFSSAFDSCPHGSSMLRAVGTRSRDIDKSDPRIKPTQYLCCRHCDFVGFGPIFRLLHAARGDAETKKAGVEARETGFDRFVMP